MYPENPTPAATPRRAVIRSRATLGLSLGLMAVAFAAPNLASAQGIGFAGPPVGIPTTPPPTTPPGTTPAGTTPTTPADTTAPTVTDDVLDADTGDIVWRANAFHVALSASDADGSGVASIEYVVLPAAGGTGDSGIYSAGDGAGSGNVVLNDGDRVKYRATDNAGNHSAWQTSEPVHVDTHAARVTASSVPTTWQKDDVEVTFSGQDAPELSDPAGSGIDSTWYQIVAADGTPGTWTAYNADTPPTLANGEFLKYYTVDVVGNITGLRSTGKAKVDTVAPLVSFDPEELPDTAQSAPVQVTLHASDALSGAAGGTYRIVHGKSVVSTGSWNEGTIVSLGDGQKVEATLLDNAGNSTTASTVAAVVDGLAPKTTDDVPLWSTSAPVTVTLTASDTPPASDHVNGSTGVLKTFYQVHRPDGSPYTDPLVYDADNKPTLEPGETITYYSVDNAANRESSRLSAVVHVDALKPKTMASSVPAGWVTSPVTITLTAADTGGSGIDTTYYTVYDSNDEVVGDSDVEYDAADKPVLHNGEYLTYFSVDVAGNSESEQSTDAAKVDGDAPSVDWEFSDGSDASNYLRSPDTANASASDPLGGSGVKEIRYQLKHNGVSGDAHVYNAAAAPQVDDGDTVIFWAVDNAGNESDHVETDRAYVDELAPTVSFSASPAAVNGYYRTAPSVTATLTDAKSGVSGAWEHVISAGQSYTRLGGDDGDAFTETVGDGATFYVEPVDNAGNTGAPVAFGPVKVDAQAPVTTASALPATSTTAVPVTLTASDSGSGVARTLFQVIGADNAPVGDATTYNPAAPPVLANGQSLRYWSVDALGNTEAAKVTSAAVVVPAPVVPAAPVATPAPLGDLGFASGSNRLVLKGNTVPVLLTCGPAACQVRTKVTFVQNGKTKVTLKSKLSSIGANAKVTERFSVSASQLLKIEQMMGANGTGGEIRISTVLVNASGTAIGKPVITRRGLRNSSAA